MRLLLTFPIVLIVFFAQAQNSLIDLTNNFEKDEQIKNASWSIMVKNLNSGETILEKDEERSLIPASTLKILSTGLALKELGSNYRFKTLIGYTGRINDTALIGNLVIKGGGDPGFGNGYDVFLYILNAIEKKGIKKIYGNIILDLSHYGGSDLTPDTWVYQDLGNYYGASPSSFCYQENFEEVHFIQNNTEGELVELDTSMELLEFVEINSEVQTGPPNSGDRAYVYGFPNASKYSIRGTIPPGEGKFSIKASLPNPGEFFLQDLEERLDQAGIYVFGQSLISAEAIPLKDVIISLNSSELKELIKETNTNSNNLYAEQILNELLFNLNLVKEKPIKAQKAFRELFSTSNLYHDGMFVFDGSGLSRYNSICTKSHVEFLESMSGSEVFEDFYQSLAIGGETGTVKDMFKTIGDREFRIKSGTLNRVRAYTGYIKNDRDELIAFSIIVNNYSGSSSKMKKKLEEIMIAISLE